MWYHGVLAYYHRESIAFKQLDDSIADYSDLYCLPTIFNIISIDASKCEHLDAIKKCDIRSKNIFTV